jgi:CYTH domain-containing protein
MIENEIKYILSFDSVNHVYKLNGSKCFELYQGYDKNGARFRKQNNEYFFNYKLLTKDGIEEFECSITEQEFNRCYDICIEKIHKIRYTIVDEYLNTWDIDFFYDSNNNLYFCMAECELLDEKAIEPEKILSFVNDFLVYQVPRNETKMFTSRKISDIDYAQKLTKLVRKQNGS